jgi:hypothetical protein
VDKGHVRLEGFRPGNDFRGSFRFAHDPKVVLDGEEFLEAQTKNALTIRH